MTPIGAYAEAIAARLAAAVAENLVINNIQIGVILAGIPVLTEDANDLETQIQTAIDQTGMLILIGMPAGQDTGQSISASDDRITSAIAVGENPTLWRDKPLTKPVCLDVVYAVKASLQGFFVPGYGQQLHATRFDYFPNKNRQLYEITIESRMITQQTTV